MNKDIKAVNFLRQTSISTLVVLSSFWFIFALLSGAEEYGGGFSGVLKNSPNALPWLILFVITYIAWKRELIGGIGIIIAALFSVYFFETYRSLVVFLGISFPLFTIGSFLILSWHLSKNK